MSEPLKPGDRIELHPATDAWMQGDRYGTIVALTFVNFPKHATPAAKVRLDKSRRTTCYAMETLTPVR